MLKEGKDYLVCNYCNCMYIPQASHLCTKVFNFNNPNEMPKQWIVEIKRYKKQMRKEKIKSLLGGIARGCDIAKLRRTKT